MDMDRVTRLTAIRLLFGQAPQGQKLYSSAGNNAINWRDGHETTDEENAQIDAEFERLKQLDSYQHPRRVAYPSWQDQLDKMYHDGFDAWKETIKAVKDANPKP